MAAGLRMAFPTLRRSTDYGLGQLVFVLAGSWNFLLLPFTVWSTVHRTMTCAAELKAYGGGTRPIPREAPVIVAVFLRSKDIL